MQARSVYVETHQPQHPHNVNVSPGEQLSMNYVLKPETCSISPAYSCVFEPPYSKPFEKSNLTPPLGFRILPLFRDSKIDLNVFGDVIVSHIPPWSQSEPQISVSDKIVKYSTNPEIHKQTF